MHEVKRRLLAQGTNPRQVPDLEHIGFQSEPGTKYQISNFPGPQSKTNVLQVGCGYTVVKLVMLA